MTRFTLVPGLVLAFLALNAQANQDMTPSLGRLEDQLFILVNRSRSDRGLPELRFAEELHALARAHSLKMLQEERLSHDFPGYDRLAVRAQRTGLRLCGVGENLAVGTIFIMRLFHERMLESPGHSENIFYRGFTHMGVGIAAGDGKYYITEEFACLPGR
jgi:uncharacterized protein YkwD